MRLGRTERKLFEINDRLTAIDREQALARDELVYHRHLDDDAQRDAAVSGSPIDRADARETAGDVARFEALIAELDRERQALEAKRARLIDKLQ